MAMRKRVAGKIKYVGDKMPKPCCSASDKILNEKLEEEKNDEETEKKVKHTK